MKLWDEVSIVEVGSGSDLAIGEVGELQLVRVRQEVVLVHVEGELFNGLIVASWSEECSSSKQDNLPAPQVVSMGLQVPSMKTAFQACGRSPTSNESPGSFGIKYFLFSPFDAVSK